MTPFHHPHFLFMPVTIHFPSRGNKKFRWIDNSCRMSMEIGSATKCKRCSELIGTTGEIHIKEAALIKKSCFPFGSICVRNGHKMAAPVYSAAIPFAPAGESSHQVWRIHPGFFWVQVPTKLGSWMLQNLCLYLTGSCRGLTHNRLQQERCILVLIQELFPMGILFSLDKEVFVVLDRNTFQIWTWCLISNV